jgi:hypothetical protein
MRQPSLAASFSTLNARRAGFPRSFKEGQVRQYSIAGKIKVGHLLLAVLLFHCCASYP